MYTNIVGHKYILKRSNDAFSHIIIFRCYIYKEQIKKSMEHNKKSGDNDISKSLGGTKIVKNETSSTYSHEDHKDTVVKITCHHETVHNAHLFPRLDCNRCCYAAQKKYYSIDDINIEALISMHGCYYIPLNIKYV